MEEKKSFIPLKDLEIYQLARKLSSIAWRIYSRLSYQEKKVWGDQMLESVVSVGANIAESYGQFHYLDRVRFLYNSRGSILEAINHWLNLREEREIISKEEFTKVKMISDKLSLKLNNYIQSIYNSKKELK